MATTSVLRQRLHSQLLRQRLAGVSGNLLSSPGALGVAAVLVERLLSLRKFRDI